MTKENFVENKSTKDIKDIKESFEDYQRFKTNNTLYMTKEFSKKIRVQKI